MILRTLHHTKSFVRIWMLALVIMFGSNVFGSSYPHPYPSELGKMPPCTPPQFFTQASIDNFATNYPGCTEIFGNLYIGPSVDITNLNGLAQITKVTAGHL